MRYDSGIAFALEFDGKGGCKELHDNEILDDMRDGKLCWVHMDAKNPDSRKWLTEEVGYIDNIILDALLAEETHPRILEVGEGMLLILRGVNLNEGADPEDMISIRIWIDPKRIISTKHRQLKAVQDIKTKLEEGNGPTNVGDFVSMLAARLFERMEPVFTQLDDMIDEIEEEVIERPNQDLRNRIVSIRKQAIIMRRYMAPQRDVMLMLFKSEELWLSDLNHRQLQEAFDRVSRYIETLDSIRDRAQIVKDEINNLLSDKLNKNMYIVSLLTAVFLPMTFLTGLLGSNIGGIPGSNDPEAFWDVTLFLVVILVFQLYIFKKMKWF